jgi:CBS domain-containing protein
VSNGEARAPVESLIVNTTIFLRRFPPFDAMDEAALRFLASRLKLGYYPKDTTILSPQQGTPRALFIIKRGLVHVTPPDAFAAANVNVHPLGPGELFSLGACLEERPVSGPYVAAADTFCFELTLADLREVIERSPRIREFVQGYLRSLVRESRRLLAMQYSGTVAEQQAMNRGLRSLLRRAPVTCPPGTSIREVLEIMSRNRVGSMIVVTPENHAAGILTQHDIIDRVVLSDIDQTQPIAAIMTPDPVTLNAESTAFEAAFTMAQHGVRHIPVVDGQRVIGVVTERDLFALQRISVRQINVEVARAGTPEALQHIAGEIRRLARSLMGQGVAAEQLTLIVSSLNDALTRRILELEAKAHGVADTEWCWLAFGSEGRYEQTVSTDQDNGIVFADPADDDRKRVREVLLPFALAVNRRLDECGFPLCAGEIMASNPRWCLSLSEWREQFGSWIADTDPEALLFATIFFDFRGVYGRLELADALRRKLLDDTTENPRFLRQLAEKALITRPPLGILREFRVDDDGPYAGTLDLKKAGARVFVDVARVIGLATGTVHTSTAQRLREGGIRAHMPDDEVASAIEAFFFIQMLRLRQQLAAEMPDQREAHNRLNPEELNAVDRRVLKECFRQARKLQSRLALDYQL